MNRAILPGLVILVLSVFLTYEFSKDIHLFGIQAGGSPVDYVNQKMSPENFSKDFLGTAWATHYDRSIVMRTFYWAKSWFGISPEVFTYPFMFFQILFVTYAVYFLLGSMFPALGTASLIVVPVLLTQWIAGVDLSRFGAGLGSLLQLPLYYGWAWGSFFMALGFSLRRNINGMFLFLALACLCHVTIGFLGSAFIGVWYFLNFNQTLNRKFLTAFGVFLVVVVVHVFVNVGLSSNIADGVMNKNDWLKTTMLHCYHWYPITMGMFAGNGPEVGLIGWASLLFALVVYFFDWKSEVFRKIVCGIGVSILFMGAGVFFAEIKPIPTIIKISPQRISSLMTFVMMACFLSILVQRIGLYFKNATHRQWVLLALGIFTLVYSGREAHRMAAQRINKLPEARAHMDAQIWAKDNTAAEALFVVDPADSYNWQTFSIRSSYGTFRDWGFNGLGYTSNDRLFQEGKRRSLLFDVNVDSIKIEDLKEAGTGPIWRRFLSKIRAVYYSMTSADLKRFAQQESVDYFVFSKEHMQSEIRASLAPAFENQHYFIVRADQL